MPKTENILSFSPYAYWRIHALYEVALCHNLQWRGHSFNYVNCDGLFSNCDMVWESTVGPRPANACAVCQSQVKSMLEGCRIPNTWLGKYKVPGDDLAAESFEQNLNDPELLEAVFNGSPVGAWVKSSVHTHLRINTIDLLNPKHCATLRSYIRSGVIAITTINRMLDALQPTILLLFNGRMSVTRIALELAKARGIRVVCHERGISKESLLLWENEGCLSLRPYARLWQEWGEVPLGRSEVAKVTQWLVDRAHGTNLNWRAFSVQSSLGVVGDFLDAHQGKKVWSLFTSSTDEIVAELEYSSAFVTQYRWIEETVAFARRTPAIALVIRVHPNSGGKKSNGRNQEELEFFRRLQATLPANVALVMPDDEVSTYALIDRADLGLVYGSTVALEMACRGKKVLLGARTRWMSCGSIELLTEPQNYASILATHAALRPDAAEAEKIAIAAYRFAYAYVQRWNIPFPLIRMPNVYTGVLTAKTLGELKPGVHDCLDYCADIVLGLRPSVPVASAPVRSGAQREELESLRVGLKLLAGDPAAASGIRASVVLTCHNRGQHLRECVRSVANQTFRNLELIIVNDGSTDDSAAVAGACLKEFSHVRITLVNQPGSGQPALARNAGIARAQGEFILPLDAGDQLDARYLEEAFDVIEADPGVDLVYSDSLCDNGKTRSRKKPGRFEVQALAAANQPFYCCVYRRKLWEKIGGYRANVRGCEDWDFWLAASLTGTTAAYIPRVGILCHETDGGVDAPTSAHLQAGSAQVMLNNPAAYSPAQLEQARALLDPVGKQKPPAVTAGDFGQILTEAEKLVRAGQLEAAIAKLEQTLPLAPNAECAGRANEILELLRGARSEAAAPAETQPATAAGDLFGADEVQNIRQLIATYENNPNGPLREQLVDFQQHLMSFLVTADRDALESQFRGSLGEVVRALVQSGLSAASPADETAGQLAVLDESLRKTAQHEAVFDFRPLLARMLLAPAHRGSMVVVPDKIPAWLLGDYLRYLQRVPRPSATRSEAGEYCAHMLRWVRVIVERIRTAPDEALTLQLASFFADEANLSALGFNGSAPLELAEKRAAILELVLERKGEVVGARSSKRPQAQLENQDWLQTHSREAV